MKTRSIATLALTTAASLSLTSTAVLATSCSATLSRGSHLAKTQSKIYAFESDASGFQTKNFFYDNGEEVVVFDTQFSPEIAQKSLDYIRTVTKNPITHVVLTHPNPDKFNGMSVFQKIGAKVIASRRTVESMPGVHAYKKAFFVQVAKMFTEESYPSLSQVDLTFEKQHDLRLGNGETILLQELESPGVSSNQTIASVPSAHALIVGDLVHYRTHAWLEGGIVNGRATPTLEGWIANLRELQKLFKANPSVVVYGGRGDSVTLETAVREQIQYLTKANTLVDQYLLSLGDRKREIQGAQAQGHYRSLQLEFEKAFPGYQMGFMIQYGVYGLANSKL